MTVMTVKTIGKRERITFLMRKIVTTLVQTMRVLQYMNQWQKEMEN